MFSTERRSALFCRYIFSIFYGTSIEVYCNYLGLFFPQLYIFCVILMITFKLLKTVESSFSTIIWQTSKSFPSNFQIKVKRHSIKVTFELHFSFFPLQLFVIRDECIGPFHSHLHKSMLSWKCTFFTNELILRSFWVITLFGGTIRYNFLMLLTLDLEQISCQVNVS